MARSEIFVSNKDIKAAKDRLLKMATATTMGRGKVICVFYNTYFLVEAHNSKVDVRDVLNRLLDSA